MKKRTSWNCRTKNKDETKEIKYFILKNKMVDERSAETILRVFKNYDIDKKRSDKND